MLLIREMTLLNYEHTGKAHQLSQADQLSYITRLRRPNYLTHNIDNNKLTTLNTAEES